MIMETEGLRERQDTYQKGKAYPIDQVIPRRGKRSRVKMPRRPTSVGCNRNTSFNFTEGLPVPPTIILSPMGVKERYELAVTCPHEIQIT